MESVNEYLYLVYPLNQERQTFLRVTGTHHIDQRKPPVSELLTTTCVNLASIQRFPSSQLSSRLWQESVR